MERIGDRLRWLRKTLRIKQGEFAEKIGLKQGSYSGIENNKESLSWRVMRLICLEFGVNAEWLQNGGDLPVFTDKMKLSVENELLEIYKKLMPETQQDVFGYMKEKLELQEFRENQMLNKPEKSQNNEDADD